MLFLNMVRYLKENGSSQVALARLNDIMGNFTSSSTVKDAYLLRGYLHENLGMYDECVKDVDKVLSYNNKDEEARFLKAECLKISIKLMQLRYIFPLLKTVKDSNMLQRGKL